MNALQVNAELLHELSLIAEDENLMKKALKAIKKLVSEKESSVVEKKEFFTSLDRGEEQYRQGATHRIESVDELKSFLNSL